LLCRTKAESSSLRGRSPKRARSGPSTAETGCPCCSPRAVAYPDTVTHGPGRNNQCWYCPGTGATVFSWRNFCISVFNETLTPTGGITCLALGNAVIRHLLRPRLTSARSSRRLSTLGSTVTNAQISQGNSRDLPAYACRIYVTAFRASIGLWGNTPPYPAVPPHPLPVRQASILPRASFRFAVTRDTLASG